MATRDPYEQRGGGRRNEAYSEGPTNQYPQNSADNVVTRQPQRKGNDEGPVKFNPENPDACVSAQCGVGSCSKDCCDGWNNLECIGPNAGCVLSSECENGPAIVMDCTFEICSADCLILKFLLFKLGLALDTKVTWAEDEAAFEVLGTGIDTSEGFAIGALGSKLGIGIAEKREKKLMKKRKE